MKKVMEQNAKAVTEAQIKKVLTNGELSKSKKMIALFEMGLEVKTIQKLMSEHEGKEVRYNFVYNVVSNYCNMNGIQVETNKKEGAQKKDQIIALFLEGKSNKEIAIELKTNYNYVHNVLKEYKAKHPELAKKAEVAN